MADLSAAATSVAARAFPCGDGVSSDGDDGSSESELDISMASAAAAPVATRALGGGDDGPSGSESGISMISIVFLPSEEDIVALAGFWMLRWLLLKENLCLVNAVQDHI